MGIVVMVLCLLEPYRPRRVSSSRTLVVLGTSWAVHIKSTVARSSPAWRAGFRARVLLIWAFSDCMASLSAPPATGSALAEPRRVVGVALALKAPS